MGLMEIGKYDIVHKGRYEDDLVHEIIPCVDRSFPTSRDRCGTLNRRYISENDATEHNIKRRIVTFLVGR